MKYRNPGYNRLHVAELNSQKLDQFYGGEIDEKNDIFNWINSFSFIY